MDILNMGERYGVPEKVDDSLLLLTGRELLEITEILRQMTTDMDILHRIEELEKPFKKNLNSEETK